MRIQGTDGKSYPAAWYTADEREYIKGRCHYLSHGEGRSVREIVEILEADHNVKRSVGAVHSYLTDWKCVECSGDE